VSSRSRPNRPYNRILLKLSGECFADTPLLGRIIDQLVRARKHHVAVAVVCGGGNILRGRDTGDIDRAAADRAGMLATVINGIRLRELLASKLESAHLCARAIPGFVEGYSVERGRAELDRGRILVLSGGTGNPFFSTDSAAALRAAELGCDAILKATNVTGIYSADPRTDPDAKLYRRLTYARALAENLRVMDLTAFALCMERRIPIRVFDIRRRGAIFHILHGKQIGSCVC
jgi:uridylate kinase